MQHNSVLHFGDRVALQCEQQAVGFLGCHSSAEPSLVLMNYPEVGMPRHFERCVFTLEHVTTWAATSKHAASDDEPLMFGHFVRIRHAASGAPIVAMRTRKANNLAFGEAPASNYAVRLGTPQETSDALSVWRVVSKYKIRQEGERVVAGDHVVLLHDTLQLNLSVGAPTFNSADDLLPLHFAAVGTAFSFVVSEPRHVAASRDIHAGRCILLFHKEQEAFLALADRDVGAASRLTTPGLAFGSTGSSSKAPHKSASLGLPPAANKRTGFLTPGPNTPSTSSRGTDELGRSLCLMYPHIKNSTYNIVNLPFSSNGLWMLESPNVINSDVIQIAPACYRLKHLASGHYLSADKDDTGAITLVSDINELQENATDMTLWALTPAGEAAPTVSSAATFFRLSNVAASTWLTVVVSTHQQRLSMLPSGDPTAPVPILALSERTKSRFDGERSDSDESDAPAAVFAIPPQGAVARPAASDAAPPVASDFDATEPYLDYLDFGRRTAESAAPDAARSQAAVSLGDKPSYVDVFCAVSVPDAVARNLGMVLGHSRALQRFLRAMRTDGAPDDEARHQQVVRLAAATSHALKDLIPFCTVSEVTDVLEREGLAIEANQRILIDQQVHLRALEVLFSPVVSPSVGLHELRENSLATTGALLSWQLLGAAVTTVSGAVNEMCTLCCRFLKLVSKNNQSACEQLQPFLPALLCFLQAVPQVAGVISEIVRCTPTDPQLATTICQQVLSQDSDVIAENLGMLGLLTDLCYLHGRPNLAVRRIVLKALCDNGVHIVPQFKSVGTSLTLSCPAAMHGDPQSQSLVSFCASLRSTTFLSAAVQLMAAVLPSADEDPRARAMIVLDVNSLSAALDEPIPARLRCAFILYANVLVAFYSAGGSQVDSGTVIPWSRELAAETAPSAEKLVSLRERVLHVLHRYLNDNQFAVRESVAEMLPTVNAALSFFITIARWRMIPPTEVPDVADAVFALIESLPSPTETPSLRPWSEKTVLYMECVHHATACITAFLDAEAAAVAFRAFDAFRSVVPHEATPDDNADEEEARVADAILENVSTIVAESSQNASLCRPGIISKLVELSTFEHPALPNDTLSLAFRMLIPAHDVVARLTESVISFAESSTDSAALLTLASGFRECSALLRVPALRHLHSDVATRELHQRQLALAFTKCLSAIDTLPETAFSSARVLMTCFDFHDQVINFLDNPDALASACFDREEDHGTITMRAVRLLGWFVRDEPRNKNLVVQRFAILSNLATSSHVLLSKEYCALVTELLSDPTDVSVQLTTMIECLIAEVAHASKEHLDLIEVVTANCNMETQERMRAAIAVSLPGTGRILDSKAESMLGVLRALSLSPRTDLEAESLAASVPFDALIKVMAERCDEMPLLEAGCIAGVNIHLEAPLRETNPVGEIPTITLEEISRLRDRVFPSLSSHFFSPKATSKLRGCPMYRDEQFATSAIVARFVTLLLSVPAVSQFHRLLAGAAADLATTSAHFVTRALALDEGRSTQRGTFQRFHDLLECLDGFLRPTVPAQVAAPLAHLRTIKHIVSLAESEKKAAAQGAQGLAPSAASASRCDRSIALRWLAVTHRLADQRVLPTPEELAPMLELFKDQGAMEVCIHHLSASDLNESVTVAVLESMRCMLEAAQEDGDAQLVAEQDRLVKLHATPLISMLLECPAFVVVKHAIKFGIALLEGGNKKVQDSLINYFSTNDEKFFLTIRKILKESERSISHRVKMNCDRLVEPETPASLLEDLLRLLQLCCEGHHVEFQNYVRHQHDNFNTYNMCVTIMELLHTALIRLDETTVPIVMQGFNTLTEFCQGPCGPNQEAIVGCNVVTEVNRLLTNTFEGDAGEELLSIKMAAIICLSSLLEGTQGATIPNLMLTSLDLPALEGLLAEAWESRSEDDMLDLGFQMYVLAGTLIAQGDKVKAEPMKAMLARSPGHSYFSVNLCCIEIWRDDDPEFTRLEVIFFRKPDICKLRDETKEVVLNKVNRSSIISKHSDFVRLADDLIFEMEHQFGIEAFAAEQPAWMNPFGLLKAQPRLAEDFLLALAFMLNGILILSENDPPLLIDVLTALLGVATVLASMYLTVVRFVLLTPLVAHRRHAESVDKAEEDPFLALPTLPERLRSVSTRENLVLVLNDGSFQLYTMCAVLGLSGICLSRFFFAFLMIQVVHKYPLLGNIVKAITMNGRQLLLTAFLGVVAIYFFSVVGFLFFHEHFDRSEADAAANNCDTLMQCFFYSFSKGLRGGGGISEAMKDNLWGAPHYYFREAYDTLYFVVVAVIIMNIVFALIVDTFAELRDARKRIEEDMMTTCFICGIDAATFDRAGEGFKAHTKGAHNMWQYLYFMHHLRRKDKDEFTGQESYVAAKMNKFDLSFFPVNRSKSLENMAKLTDSGDDGANASHGGGISAADVKRIVEEVIGAQLKEHMTKVTLQAQQQAAANTAAVGAAAAGEGDSGAAGGSLWGLARSRSLAVMRRSTSAPAPKPAAARDDDADEAPVPQQKRAVGFAALIKNVRELGRNGALNRDRDAAAASDGHTDDEGPLALQRVEVGRMKKEAKALLEILRAGPKGPTN